MVQVEKGHVAVVFLNDPERRNPLSPEMALSLLQALDDLEADPGVRVVYKDFPILGEVSVFGARAAFLLTVA